MPNGISGARAPSCPQPATRMAGRMVHKVCRAAAPPLSPLVSRLATRPQARLVCVQAGAHHCAGFPAPCSWRSLRAQGLGGCRACLVMQSAVHILAGSTPSFSADRLNPELNSLPLMIVTLVDEFWRPPGHWSAQAGASAPSGGADLKNTASRLPTAARCCGAAAVAPPWRLGVLGPETPCTDLGSEASHTRPRQSNMTLMRSLNDSWSIVTSTSRPPPPSSSRACSRCICGVPNGGGGGQVGGKAAAAGCSVRERRPPPAALRHPRHAEWRTAQQAGTLQLAPTSQTSQQQ